MFMNLKEKSARIKDIISNQNHTFLVNESNCNTPPYDYVIAKLDCESQRIIYYDYIIFQHPKWYIEYYSKSTYYRLKNIAVDKFLSFY